MPQKTLPVPPAIRRTGLLAVILLLAACGSLPPDTRSPPPSPPAAAERAGHEIVLFALGLIDTGYRFGGKNPEAGLDCSGMVSYIYGQTTPLALRGSAAEIAQHGRPVDRTRLRPGDLVFFNTRNTPYSHVGIYIGDDRIVHAPSSNGRVRIDALGDRYYAQRFQAARTYLD